MLEISTLAAVVIPALLFVLFRYISFANRLSNIPGPPSPSSLIGHDLIVDRQTEVGDLDFAWMKAYGGAWRLKGAFGVVKLSIVDPAAIHHVFHAGGYNYPKVTQMTQFARLVLGRGLIWAYGDIHQRQRLFMNPAFTAAQLRSFFPVFRHAGAQVIQRWKDEFQTHNTSTRIIDAQSWMTKAALDIIGETAFNYRFGCLDEGNQKETELGTVFHNLFAEATLHPPVPVMLFQESWAYIPLCLLRFTEYIPVRMFQGFRRFQTLGKQIGRELIADKRAVNGEGEKDILSILANANQAQDSKNRLDEDEVLSQVTTLMFAGHETTASTLSWTLCELARHPEDQKKVRDEILSARAKCITNGGGDFTTTDFESLTFTNAVIKEGLRMYTVVPQLQRYAKEDDVIPLSTPIVGVDGTLITEIPVVKGQVINLAMAGYNRLTSVWGEDAHEWNPRRFLDASLKGSQLPLGLLANLITFAGGLHGCIGWKFALIEMQSILVDLIENFEFSPLEGVRVMRVFTGGMMNAMVEGRYHEGTQMPLQVSLVQH